MSGYRVIVETTAGEWVATARLFAPDGTNIGKFVAATPAAAVISACTRLTGIGEHDAAIALQRHWSATAGAAS